MTIEELSLRFPEIPRDLLKEPVVAEVAQVFEDLLTIAKKPSNCTTQYDTGHQCYLKLIVPMGIYGYGLTTREKVLKELQSFLDQYKADPQGFVTQLGGSKP